MFRVRFHEHTEGYQPAQNVNDVAERLSKLLKKQRMVLSHTDERGFACYVRAEVKKARKRHACPNCGYVRVP